MTTILLSNRKQNIIQQFIFLLIPIYITNIDKYIYNYTLHQLQEKVGPVEMKIDHYDTYISSYERVYNRENDPKEQHFVVL